MKPRSPYGSVAKQEAASLQQEHHLSTLCFGRSKLNVPQSIQPGWRRHRNPLKINTMVKYVLPCLGIWIKKQTNRKQPVELGILLWCIPLCHGPEPILNSIFQYLKPPSWAHHKTKSGPAWQYQDIEGLWRLLWQVLPRPCHATGSPCCLMIWPTPTVMLASPLRK